MFPMFKHLSAARDLLGLPHGSMSSSLILQHSIWCNFIRLECASGGCSRSVLRTSGFEGFHYSHWFLNGYMTPNGGHKNITFIRFTMIPLIILPGEPTREREPADIVCRGGFLFRNAPRRCPGALSEVRQMIIAAQWFHGSVSVDTH